MQRPRRGGGQKGKLQGPRLLTEDVRRKLLTAVNAGSPAETATTYAGVSLRVFRLWCRKGRDELQRRDSGLAANTDLDVYVSLWQSVLVARADADAWRRAHR